MVREFFRLAYLNHTHHTAALLRDDTGHATSKQLSNKELTIFRVGILITLKMAILLILNALWGAPNGRRNIAVKLLYLVILKTLTKQGYDGATR